ncbi:SIS domain-containing protein [Synechococcus sp. MIT S9452]|uniref:SIS domain-containing protein n=1 Tax=Synechococcus sp. MIT S9452 TaxID=3082546 RepID=UPI0039A560A3
MTVLNTAFLREAKDYLKRVHECFTENHFKSIELLASDLMEAWIKKKQVFICGNGGSAANALHIANDLHYGIGACGPGPTISGIRVEALPANPGVMTCLANDIGYENVFSHQLEVKANQADVLLVLSGSGNSPNVVNALQVGNELGMKTYAVVAYDGGKCKEIADQVIHFQINDMQIAEDTQLLIGHICMQWLNNNKANVSR